MSAAPVSPEISPEISVVIAAYNRPDTLTWALRSLVAQTFTDWEAIVVMDHADAATVAAVEAFTDPRIRGLNLPMNIGEQSGPNNVGAALARGRYLAFLNHDDFWLSDHLDVMWTTAAARSADFVLSQCFGVSPFDPSKAFPENAAAYLMTKTVRGAYRPNVSFCGVTNWLVRKETFDGLKGFRSAREIRTATSEDLLRRYVRRGGRPVLAPQATSLALHSGIRSQSYVSGLSSEHEAVGTWLATQTPTQARAQLLPRLFRPPSDHGLARVATYMGLPVRMMQMSGQHRYCKGHFINRLRKIRGLAPLSAQAFDAAALKIANGALLDGVGDRAEIYPRADRRDRQLCFSGWHPAERSAIWSSERLSELRWRWARRPKRATVTVRLHLHAMGLGWQCVVMGTGSKILRVAIRRTPPGGVAAELSATIAETEVQAEQSLWLWTPFLAKAAPPDQRVLGLALGRLAIETTDEPLAVS